jgi:hypothetical protein
LYSVYVRVLIISMSASFTDDLRIPPRPPRLLHPVTLRLGRRAPWAQLPLAALAGFAAAALCAAGVGW